MTDEPDVFLLLSLVDSASGGEADWRSKIKEISIKLFLAQTAAFLPNASAISSAGPSPSCDVKLSGAAYTQEEISAGKKTVTSSYFSDARRRPARQGLKDRKKNMAILLSGREGERENLTRTAAAVHSAVVDA